MSYKIEVLMVSFLFISGGNILAGMGSICVIIYYVSKTKIDVVDLKYNGSWKEYIKSIYKKTN